MINRVISPTIKTHRTIIVVLMMLLTSIAISTSFTKSVEALSGNAAGFDAGNIMSDAVMSNKNSMNQSQIQSFLNKNNSCKINPKNPSVLTAVNKAGTYGYLMSGSTKFKYHLKDGKFVCLANQSFNGESAARIIYRAAQDYSINPQVLIVLLEKENGLITDNWPNYNFQYATATGYACPDSGPNNSANCNSNYFGFKNQIRHAANMFRTLLNGQGFNNYPVGNNDILYNPSSSCGSKVVNVKNRATGALYTYTPYQPNPATLKRNWPVTQPLPSCGAYGNLNFYMMFSQWFGDPQGIVYRPMKIPRKLQAIEPLRKTSLTTLEADGSSIKKDHVEEFTTSTSIDGVQYLRTANDTKNKVDYGIPYSKLKTAPNIIYENTVEPITFRASKALRKTSLYTKLDNGTSIKKNQQVVFSSYTVIEGVRYYRTQLDTKRDADFGVPESNLRAIFNIKSMKHPRQLQLKNAQSKTSLYTTAETGTKLSKGQVVSFNKSATIGGIMYLITNHDARNGNMYGVPYKDLKSVPSFKFSSMKYPRKLKATENLSKTSLYTMKQDGTNITKGQIISFTTTIVVDNVRYLRTAHDSKLGIAYVIPYSKLRSY